MYPVKKNDQVIADIVDLTHEGLGVAKIEGYPIFVENALPTEKVNIHILKTGKKFGFGKVISYLEKSAVRNEDLKQELIRTGIAPLQHMTYEAQLTFKREQVVNVLEKIAKMTDVEVAPTLGMAEPYRYRNKAQIPVRRVDGELSTGFYRKNSHDLVPIEDFYIQHKEIDDAIIAVRDILRRFKVKPYNEEDHTGLIRHIIVRRGFYTEEMMIVLVTRVAKIFQVEKIVEAIAAELPHVVSIMQNINGEKTNVILGKETRNLFGKEFITDQLLGNQYQISAGSFFQVNTEQAEKLYQTAIDFADLKSSDIVIDAYCGIGTIGLSLANKVKHVYGMEIVPQAVKDARTNQQINYIENATFEVGAAEKLLPKWQAEGVSADVLIVDPPRKGLAESFIETSAEMSPDKIVYVSCNPASFARDVKRYEEHGYRLAKVQPVDMFPQTNHVETIVLLQRADT
ncbi:23S rRNA (uracil(1939)-C(5))-methyltransferase RlmD [Vagococcus elongatus]|uniref:23S rRNA (Uracil(1939)-C(5))-methyltransferase RlmD n=1 Tax=Vagococcus elongatus TaxID=180344 RepID=A0A430AQW8_9ENTE|nr:23S rRNA (uracil(1939)-C(5))-methyltransferase RlmD [Vagococcus elongatus]RSU10522.1 23S rRNA (uracil(1939)-C(5))-methyltransferase RlmD [Vagococcus elongatus]